MASKPGEWPAVTLDGVARFENRRRIPLSAANRSKRPGPFPYWGANGPIDSLDGFLFDEAHVLVAEDGNTVVRSDGRGTVHWATGRYWVNNHAHVLSAKEGVNLRWLFYALRHAQVAPFVTGSAQPKLSMGNLSRLPIVRPPEDEQNRIAAVLGALDGKIAAEQQLHDRLLMTADLAFIRVCERARRSGVRPVAASELLSVNPRVPIPRGQTTAFLEMAATDAWAVRPSSLGARPFSSGCKFERGDTLLAKITGCIEHGKGAFVDFVDDAAAGSTEFLVLRAGDRLTPESVFLLSRWSSVRTHLIKRMTGSSGRQRVPADAFSSLELTVPSALSDWTSEAALIKAAFARGHQAWSSQRRLRAIRDELLPKLITGKIRVAEDFAPDAAIASMGYE